ncbi:hypothetical protein QTL68_01620 [Pseudomonas aeruginosa]|uniref:hypothetical protein n=1 Tax=Pseudomonas aeruginosa TaxID=287 RepID=UPI00044B0963|nr:hypothetical protein [Pseudomonas aeruginosa]KAJ10371.1 hypothetical protein M002_04015 [Pseudomonas aeruginosa ID4365]MDP4470230.1 hypothetical protein [Pseudomonas aeruginosa]MDP4476433.1 hypothetical protein [Pseudomonas aeruginosa]
MRSKALKTRWGVRHYAMVNSGNHIMSVFPMDGPLSICGHNNLGKTQALQSMQFLFFTHLAHMHFGAHQANTSRAFFFPSDHSYLLMEVLTPDGVFIVGAHGKGPTAGNEYELFVAKGELDMGDFVDPINRIRPYKELFRHWYERGIEVRNLTREQMRQMLYGESGRVKGGDWDVTIVPLANANERRYQVFRQIYRNLLTQQLLKSREIKELILNVFSEKLSNANLNFLEVRERAFQRFRLAEREVERLAYRREDILALGKEYDEYAALSEEGGWLARELRVNLTLAVERAPLCIEELNALHKEEIEKRAKLNEQLNSRMQERDRAVEQRITLAGRLTRLDELRERNAMTCRETVEKSIRTLAAQHATLSDQLRQADIYDVATVSSRLRHTEHEILKLNKRLEQVRNGDGLLDTQGFVDAEKAELSRLLRSDMFSLEAAALTEIHPGSFNNWVRTQLMSKGGLLNLQGFELDLTDLPPMDFHGDDPAQLQQSIAMYQEDLAKLQGQLEVAQNQTLKRNELESLAKQLSNQQGYLQELTELAALETTETADRHVLEGVMMCLAQIDEWLQGHQERIEEATRAISVIEQKLNDALEQARQLKVVQQHRQIQNSPFILAEGPNEDFERDLTGYNFGDTLNRLEWISNALDRISLTMKNYQHSIVGDLPDLARHANLSDLVQHARERLETLPQMREMLKRYHQEGIAQLSGALRDLSENYVTLEHEISLFNRRINARKVSNLRGFRLDLKRNEPILEAINILSSYIAQADENETDLFGQQGGGASQAGLVRAMDRLSRLVEDGRDGTLELGDLFDIGFTVEEVNGKVVVCNTLDELASNGSTMTLKPLLYFSLIRHLTDRGARVEPFLPFYLDEIASVDPNNQRTILAFSENLGFTPVFASVDPTTTVRYCINISECINADNRIYVTQADWQHFDHHEDIKLGQAPQRSERDEKSEVDVEQFSDSLQVATAKADTVAQS